MKQLLQPLYNALRLVNNKAYINISKFEINDEERGLGGKWLLDMLDKIIDELETVLKNSNQNQFSLAITLFNAVMGGPTADLWNTDELLIKVIQQMPSLQMKDSVFKDTDYTISLDRILPYLSLTSKGTHKSCYKLDTKASFFLRKNGYVCLNKHTITVYDKNRHCKAVFNQDGSCNSEKTKSNLNKKLPYRNS